ncbi:hypothetical protein [Actomonas aquatica]|uniref:IPTL-CTERM protein sorting domain-containing protein n=1 Tax=Actomonas aquatica TaxID=2866162 RepID=A0ABZ1CAA0_9BACT|nr:hypothetical protein [Opitutus sp. WL0086]WRQ88428.1 hypothetical protein K1X11_003365 [Opitutus sp. WL0086]
MPALFFACAAVAAADTMVIPLTTANDGISIETRRPDFSWQPQRFDEAAPSLPVGRTCNPAKGERTRAFLQVPLANLPDSPAIERVTLHLFVEAPATTPTETDAAPCATLQHVSSTTADGQAGQQLDQAMGGAYPLGATQGGWLKFDITADVARDRMDGAAASAFVIPPCAGATAGIRSADFADPDFHPYLEVDWTSAEDNWRWGVFVGLGVLFLLTMNTSSRRRMEP